MCIDLNVAHDSQILSELHVLTSLKEIILQVFAFRKILFCFFLPIPSHIQLDLQQFTSDDYKDMKIVRMYAVM